MVQGRTDRIPLISSYPIPYLPLLLQLVVRATEPSRERELCVMCQKCFDDLGPKVECSPLCHHQFHCSKFILPPCRLYLSTGTLEQCVILQRVVGLKYFYIAAKSSKSKGVPGNMYTLRLDSRSHKFLESI